MTEEGKSVVLKQRKLLSIQQWRKLKQQRAIVLPHERYISSALVYVYLRSAFSINFAIFNSSSYSMSTFRSSALQHSKSANLLKRFLFFAIFPLFFFYHLLQRIRHSPLSSRLQPWSVDNMNFPHRSSLFVAMKQTRPRPILLTSLSLTPFLDSRLLVSMPLNYYYQVNAAVYGWVTCF